MEKVKDVLDWLKQFANKTSKKTKMIIGIVVGAVIVFAVVLAAILNNSPYQVMFADVSEGEASEIISILKSSGTDFQYKNGDFLVKEDVLDQTMAELVYQGYPTSGFTYNVFTENASLMTTDSDKRTYKLYELQDRIGATIRLFDGVKDAKVTIALGEQEKYALTDEDKSKAGASATVIMKNGGSPTKEQASAIQRLIARSVEGLDFENVSVFDGNGIEVSADSTENAAGIASDGAELARLLEDQVTLNVMNVLTPFYGAGNVRISVKAAINMDQVVTESIAYSTPEKTGEEDKSGIVSNESGSRDGSGGSTTDGGAAGTDSNTDVPGYTTGGGSTGSGVNSETYTKEYLVNQIRQQGTVSPGVLENLTISVAINGEDFKSLDEGELRALVGNAAGIAASDYEEKIALASAPFFEEEKAAQEILPVSKLERQYILMISGVALIIIIAAVLLGLKKKKKKSRKAPMAENPSAAPPPKKREQNEEVINLQNEHGMELKKSIRNFSEQNPEISAQLLKNWLNEGDRYE
ncbi:flagellar M-ring protein FliF C-terminal domain-containing protein [Parasporobacterium paucivorans]|uniref:Flagellar M-ring protein FliF n=1 Tax=Parasporobacterium paucivorans DSM 15970 TaxID=1122934 RepID=A0A1M6I7E3_9FIRM|nr:flagellar M-ring protein FliF C-terminal domain-containing protein [Parasporobacterium paucivorans]SHJ30394.1 flagellar M-ring protein FliF [Parasporobacterium paucivorans DSM 15970]